MKEKTKVAILEGVTILTNAELISYLTTLINSSAFILTQKPKVQVTQSPKAKP